MNKKNVLITAGGTAEPIDNVRKITNTGTGRLGSIVADEYAKEEQVDQIFYICALDAVRPISQRVKVIPVQSVADLENAVCETIRENQIDIVVHSMAVSDYRVRSVTGVEQIAAKIAAQLDCGNKTRAREEACREIETSYERQNEMQDKRQNERQDKTQDKRQDERQNETQDKTHDKTYGQILTKQELRELILQAFDTCDVVKESGKISSHMEAPMILLEQTPKIIPMFRKLLPEVKLVGFKLLSEVSNEELFQVAKKLMKDNACDFVLANDAAQIQGDRHRGHLIAKDGEVITYETKQEIAAGIVSATIK